MSKYPPNLRSTVAVLLALCLALAGCTKKEEPARQAITDIETAVTAAGPDAQKYAADEYAAVTEQLNGLKAKYNAKDYDSVLNGAPQLLTRAQALTAKAQAAAKQEAAQDAQEAAEREAAAQEALKTDWADLSDSVPSQIAAVESRTEILSKSKKLPANVTKDTLASAQTNLNEAKSAWQQATGAQSAGNLQEAVAAAKAAKDKLDAASVGLGMESSSGA